jgi:hypothetical protein
MKKIILSVASLTISIFSFSQLNKNTYLISGSASLSSSKNTYSSGSYYQESDEFNLKVSPNIGYFIVDKLALGIKQSLSWYKAEVTTVGGGISNIKRYDVGPFVRYYFLKKDKMYNIFTEGAYQYGLYWFYKEKGKSNTFSLTAGSVIYFNSSVGLELTAGFSSRNEDIQDGPKTTLKGLLIGIGFQFHLEK